MVQEGLRVGFWGGGVGGGGLPRSPQGIGDHSPLLVRTEVPPPLRCAPPPRNTHVITDASARKACAVASFLMHFTATLFPR